MVDTFSQNTDEPPSLRRPLFVSWELNDAEELATTGGGELPFIECLGGEEWCSGAAPVVTVISNGPSCIAQTGICT